jgi:hypothetical protein
VGPGEVVVPVVDEDLGIEVDESHQRDKGCGEQPEPHAVVRDIGGRPAMIRVPKKSPLLK